MKNVGIEQGTHGLMANTIALCIREWDRGNISIEFRQKTATKKSRICPTNIPNVI